VDRTLCGLLGGQAGQLNRSLSPPMQPPHDLISAKLAGSPGVGVAVYRVSLTDLITYPPSRDLSTACGCWLWADHPYGVACEPDADL
jgi:hypothetical protein